MSENAGLLARGFRDKSGRCKVREIRRDSSWMWLDGRYTRMERKREKISVFSLVSGASVNGEGLEEIVVSDYLYFPTSL